MGGNINQIVKNNNSHLYRESDKINLIKYMEEINGLVKELVMTG
ncbi:MAG: MobC family plasmid mobilization relaxosome protein [Lachnospiraceae bacterium]|nr:MobC family plasmid mobilization relaxosome protein [Lachnospiraceae bacterium]